MSFNPLMIPILIVGISITGWVLTTWIRAKHGYPLDDGAGGKVVPGGGDSAEVKQLRDENSRLTDQLENYADRLSVLERIVTDKGYNVAEQIEALRDTGRNKDRQIEDRHEEHKS